MLHNLSHKPCVATLAEEVDVLRQIFGNRPYEIPERKSLTIELDGYGYTWLQLREADQ